MSVMNKIGTGFKRAGTSVKQAAGNAKHKIEEAKIGDKMK